jgi:adenosylcobinamide-phosphate synthase
MDFFTPGYILFFSCLLDFLFGDPPSFPHPIRWMGQAIIGLESRFRYLPLHLVISGALFSLFLIATVLTLSVLLLQIAQAIHPYLKICLEILMIYYALSIRSLKKAAMDVYHALEQKPITEARQKVSHIVGRDIDELSESQVAQAAVESVAENLVDGFISPLFYAFIGGAPFALAYKMVNTLDSMIGYKNKDYIHFGKFAARLDDVANFLPARLSIPVTAAAAQLIVGRGMVSFRTAAIEGRHHTSPNAGYPEAAFAGALQVKLNGPHHYQRKWVDKPYIGVHFGKARPYHIRQACDLMSLSAFIWLGVLIMSSLIL